MEKVQVSKDVIEKTQKYFGEATRVMYFNKLRLSQWKSYYNIFKAATMINVPEQDILNFARILDYATVILSSKEESIDYDKCKLELSSFTTYLTAPKSVSNSNIGITNTEMALEQNKLVISKTI